MRRGQLGIARSYSSRASVAIISVIAVLLSVIPFGAFASIAEAAPVSFTGWTTERYPNAAADTWVDNGNGTVTQTVSDPPSQGHFVPPSGAVPAIGRHRITITAGLDPQGDDDYFGFLLGYSAGDVSNTNADFLLIDWKAATQAYPFDIDACVDPDSGGTALVGLAMSHVTGVPTLDELWGHQEVEDCVAATGTVTEVARATTLSGTSWLPRPSTYVFDVLVTPTVVQIWVDGVMEFDEPISPSTAAGDIALYNFSQGGITYSLETELTDFQTISLNGEAVVVPDGPGGDALRLTTTGIGGAGSAFSQTSFEYGVSSWSSTFEFRITDPIPWGGPEGQPLNQEGEQDASGDGLAFLIAGTPTQVGPGGGFLGIPGPPQPTLAIEFDTFDNTTSEGFVPSPSSQEPSGNHVGINAMGNNASVAFTDLRDSNDLDNGSVWSAWIDYDALTNEVDVYLVEGAGAVKPASPTLTGEVPASVASAFVGVENTAYPGFSSGGGAANASHEILSWTFTSFEVEAQPSVGFATGSSLVAEAGGSITVDLELFVPDEGLAEDVVVAVDTAGSATREVDYDFVSPVTFPAGSPSGSSVPLEITIIDDSESEPNETIQLGLSVTTENAVVDDAKSTHTVTILDDELTGLFVDVEEADPSGTEFDGDLPGTPILLDDGPWPFPDPFDGLRAGDDANSADVDSIGGRGFSSIGGRGFSSIGGRGFSSIGGRGLSSIGRAISSIGGRGISSIGRAISSIDLADIGRGISSIGGRGLSSIGQALADQGIPLSSIPITNNVDFPGGWSDALLGSALEGIPVNLLTFGDVLNDAPEVLEVVKLQDVDVSGSILGTLTVSSVLVGNVTMGELFPGGEPDGFTLADYCSTGPNLSSCGAESTLIDLDFAGYDISLLEALIGELFAQSIDLEQAPLGGTLLTELIAAEGSDVADIGGRGFSSIGRGLSSIDLLVDCDVFDCENLAGDRLYDAWLADAIKPDVQLGHIFLLALGLDGFIAWQDIELDSLPANLGAGARYTVSFVNGGEQAIDVNVEPPDGFAYRTGSSTLSLNGATPTVVADPTFNTDGQLVFPLSVPPSTMVELTFELRVSFQLGSYSLPLVELVSGESVLADATDQGVVSLVAPDDGTSVPESPEQLDPNQLRAFYFDVQGDVDYAELVTPQTDDIRALLKVGHPDEDFDVAIQQNRVGAPASFRDTRDDGPSYVLQDYASDAAGDGRAQPQPNQGDNDLAPIGGRGFSSISISGGSQSDAVESTPIYDLASDTFLVQLSGYNDATSDIAAVGIHTQSEEIVVTCPESPWAGYQAPSPATIDPSTATAVFLWAPDRFEAIRQWQLSEQGSDGAVLAPLERIEVEESLTRLVTALNGGDTDAGIPDLSALGLDALIIPIETSGAVAEALASRDDTPCSDDANNAAVSSIITYMDSIVDPDRVEFVTLVGGNDVLPHGWNDDNVDIANESTWASELPIGTSIYGAAATRHILTDDPYCDRDPLALPSRQLYVPDFACGRLLETGGEIVFALEQFIGAEGVLDTGTAVSALDAISTGYGENGEDFLRDGAEAIADALDVELGTAATDRSLISNTWTAGDLDEALFPTGSAEPALASVNAHFDESRMYPADVVNLSSGSAYTTAGLLGSSDRLANRIFWSVGCHSALNLPDGYAPPGGRSSVDWGQAFSGNGAVFIGNTGYGFALNSDVGLTERLMRDFAANLVDTDAYATVGEAFAFAKQGYLGSYGILGVYDEKVMQQSTLMGLPFWRLVDGAAPAAAAGALTAETAPTSISPTHTQFIGQDGEYYRAQGPVDGEYFDPLATPYRPLTPTHVEDVTGVTEPARDFWINGLSTIDVAIGDAAIVAPAYEDTIEEPDFTGVWPGTFGDVTNYLTPSGERQNLILHSGWFYSDDVPGTDAGVLRLISDSSIDLEVTYSDSADVTPPKFERSEIVTTGLQFTFTAVVSGDPTRVAVLHRPAGFDPDGAPTQWELTAMTSPLNNGIYTATFDGSGQRVACFQAKDGSGNVARSCNKAELFRANLVIAEDGSVDEGTPFPLTASFTDPENTGDYDVTVRWGDGVTDEIETASAGSIAPTHSYPAPGVYRGRVCVLPLDGGVQCDGFTATVVNLPPVVNAPATRTSANGLLSGVLATFTDGPGGRHTASIDWGDGSSVQGGQVSETNKTVSGAHGYDLPGTYPVKVTVTDSRGLSSTATTNVTVTNVVPGVLIEGPVIALEGSTVGFSYSTYGDPVGSATATCDGVVASIETDQTFECLFNDGPDVVDIVVTVGAAVGTRPVNVLNVAPIIGTLVVPIAPVAITAPVSIGVPFDDPAGANDTYTVSWDWGDGETSDQADVAIGTATAQHTYALPGVYTIGVTVSDDDGGSSSITYEYVVVFDPAGGFVTGGGWIDSPPGAYRPEPALVGKATFGFVAKYKKGQSVPDGNTQFKFKAADLEFTSTSYDWLVIAGNRAQFKGEGTLKGHSETFGFMLTAIDGDAKKNGGPDKFRIKIWTKGDEGDVIYDNKVSGDLGPNVDPPTELGGGSISVKSK